MQKPVVRGLKWLSMLPECMRPRLNAQQTLYGDPTHCNEEALSLRLSLHDTGCNSK